MNHIKEHLYDHCLEYVNSNIETARKAIAAAQEAMESENKSTAGDKHETGRAMKQLKSRLSLGGLMRPWHSAGSCSPLISQSSATLSDRELWFQPL